MTNLYLEIKLYKCLKHYITFQVSQFVQIKALRQAIPFRSGFIQIIDMKDSK